MAAYAFVLTFQRTITTTRLLVQIYIQNWEEWCYALDTGRSNGNINSSTIFTWASHRHLQLLSAHTDSFPQAQTRTNIITPRSQSHSGWAFQRNVCDSVGADTCTFCNHRQHFPQRITNNSSLSNRRLHYQIGTMSPLPVGPSCSRLFCRFCLSSHGRSGPHRTILACIPNVNETLWVQA